MKSLYAIAAVLFAFGLSFGQIDLVKQQAEINSAKADLEDSRKLRDQVVAERWQDKKAQNDERDALMDKQREAKEGVDALAAERARLFEEVRASREDLARIQEDAERMRNEFLTLSSQQDRADALTRFVDQGVPFDVPERLGKFNQLKKSIELHRDDPNRIAQELLRAAVVELRYTRQVDWQHGDLLFGGTTTMRGERVRLGGIGAIQFESSKQLTGLMLPSAGEHGRVFGWQESLALPIRQAVGKAFFEAKDSATVLFPVDVLLSTNLSTQMAQATELGLKERLVKWFHEGGLIMYPISIVGLLALLMVFERVFVIRWKGRHSRRRLRKVFELVHAGKVDEARAEGAKLKGSVGRIVQAVFRYPEGGRHAAEKGVEDVFAYELLSLERRIGTIGVFGTTAPLLGLLGTVMGMIELFGVITLYGSNDPKMLAGGISLALIATEAGLLVAIPTQLLHSWISSSVDSLVGEMETCALKLMNGLWLKG